jgi:cytochrome c
LNNRGNGITDVRVKPGEELAPAEARKTAANIQHDPETYPKFQTQTKKMALLRDMINWCIQNPLKGALLPEDDPRLRSVEAYILFARKGVALEPGKH